MFLGATSFNQDISNWDVSNGETFYGMFSFATDFDKDLRDWDVDSVDDSIICFMELIKCLTMGGHNTKYLGF